MPLQLIPPGQRKGNPFYLIRGEINGRSIEVSTKTRDEALAKIRKAELELALLQDRIPGPREEVTFARAAELYMAFKQPTEFVKKRIKALVVAIGEKLVGEVRLADFVSAADKLYPQGKNETKNRWVIKPGAAIIHYAAENEWCGWVRIRKLEEAAPRTRAAHPDTGDTLLDALHAEEARARTKRKKDMARKKRLLILWLYKHGNRISDPLRLTWEDNIDLGRKVYVMLVGKARRIVEKPLDEEVWQALANEPDQSGFVFPWRTRSGVYKWLRPLVRKLGLSFTPHMARHFVGTKLNAEGKGLKTIMAALDHRDAKSSLRYQDADVQVVREALRSLGKIEGRRKANG